MIDDDQIYVVVDIETTGPVAGLYSMLSIGAVATTETEEISSFYRKIEPLEGAGQHPQNMAFWESHPEAWQEATSNAEPADVVMKDFVAWAKSLGKRPVFVSQPVAFDYSFVSWYLRKFTDEDPFTNGQDGPVTLDLPSLIAGKFNRTLSQSRRTKLPDWMKEGMPEHSHNGLEDAQGFAVILRNVLRGNTVSE